MSLCRHVVCRTWLSVVPAHSDPALGGSIRLADRAVTFQGRLETIDGQFTDNIQPETIDGQFTDNIQLETIDGHFTDNIHHRDDRRSIYRQHSPLTDDGGRVTHGWSPLVAIRPVLVELIYE